MMTNPERQVGLKLSVVVGSFKSSAPFLGLVASSVLVSISDNNDMSTTDNIY